MMSTVAFLQAFGWYPTATRVQHSWLNILEITLYACCIQLKPIPFGPGTFEGAELLMAFVISSLVALFHEIRIVLRVSACMNWILEGGERGFC